MNITIDKDGDALYIELLENVQVVETFEINDDIYVDVDKAGNVIGVEVLNFSDYTKLNIPSTKEEAKQFLLYYKPKHV